MNPSGGWGSPSGGQDISPDISVRGLPLLYVRPGACCRKCAGPWVCLTCPVPVAALERLTDVSVGLCTKAFLLFKWTEHWNLLLRTRYAYLVGTLTYRMPALEEKNILAENAHYPWQLILRLSIACGWPSPASCISPLMFLGTMYLHLLDMAVELAAWTASLPVQWREKMRNRIVSRM